MCVHVFFGIIYQIEAQSAVDGLQGLPFQSKPKQSRFYGKMYAHTHTYIHTYIHIYLYVCTFDSQLGNG